MRASVVTVLITLFGASAAAQAPAEARVGAARLTAQDTSCLSNSYAPCPGVRRAEVEVRAGARPVRVRVVAVEALAPFEGSSWQRTDGPFLVTLSRERPRARPRPRPPEATVRPRATERVVVFFDTLPVHEGRVRVHLEVDGRRVTLEARHVVYNESPDPEF